MTAPTSRPAVKAVRLPAMACVAAAGVTTEGRACWKGKRPAVGSRPEMPGMPNNCCSVLGAPRGEMAVGAKADMGYTSS